MRIKQKKMKFVSLAKMALNSKDDFLTKLKPVLGQNQINLNNLISDLNKKNSDLNPDIWTRNIILRNPDKSFDLSIQYTPIEYIINHFTNGKPDSNITINNYQDIIISLYQFNENKKINFFEGLSKRDKLKIYSKIVISYIKSLKVGIIFEKNKTHE